MSIKSFLAICILGIALTGCTTLKDFQKMTPNERASKTCLNDSLVSHYRNNERAYSKEMRSLDDILMKGYTVVENCTTLSLIFQVIIIKNIIIMTLDQISGLKIEVKMLINTNGQKRKPFKRVEVKQFL